MRSEQELCSLRRLADRPLSTVTARSRSILHDSSFAGRDSSVHGMDLCHGRDIFILPY
jgi:hypothetical protein